MYVHGSPSDRVPYGGSTRDNSPWWISRIVGTQSIREDQHDINIPVATHGHPHSWHHKHSQTYICSTCSSYSLRWYHSNSHRIRSVPMLWCFLSLFLLYTFTSSNISSHFSMGFIPTKSKHDHHSNDCYLTHLIHSAVSCQIPFPADSYCCFTLHSSHFSKQHNVAMKSLQFPVMVHSDGCSIRSTWTCHTLWHWAV